MGRGKEEQPLWRLVLITQTHGLESECSLRVPNQGLPGVGPGSLIRASSPSMSCPVFQCFIKISAAYGSTKDISVYSVLGLPASQIFIVGRPTKKYQTQCQVGGGQAGAGGQGQGWRGSREFSYLFGHSFVHSFICSLAHSFIHSFNNGAWSLAPALDEALCWSWEVPSISPRDFVYMQLLIQ